MASPIKTVNMGATLPAGAYYFALIAVDETEQKEKKWSKGPGGVNVGVETGNMEKVLSFRFATTHPTLGDAFARAKVRPTNAPNGGLVKLLKSMAPGELTIDIIKNGDYLWAFTQSLIGRMFIVTVEPKDVYNNVKGISPAPNMQQAPPPPPAPVTMQVGQPPQMPMFNLPQPPLQPVANGPQMPQVSAPMPAHFQGMPPPPPAFTPPTATEEPPPYDDDDIAF